MAFAASVVSAQEPQIEVKLHREQVYVGESVFYEVFLNHFDDRTMPVLAPSRDFSAKVVKRTTRNSVMTTSNGFRTQRIVQRGPEITYEITPLRSGTLTIPGPTAEHDGESIQGEALLLRVVDVVEQDFVRLQLSSDPSDVYPAQKFVIRLLVSVKGLPEPVADRDPLSVQRSMPTLSIPWADDESVADGIKPIKPLSRWLNDFVDRQGRGLSINNYQGQRDLLSQFLNGDPFSGRRDGRLAFRPEPVRVLDNDNRGRKVEYWQYSFERQFLASAAGRYEFGPASFKGAIGKRIAGRQLETESVYTIAPPIAVTVREPPEEGKPAFFTGAIGQFECGAEIVPTTARVGDPMTLTIWLRGTGTLDRAAAPRLDEIPGIAEGFKVYDATEETTGDVRSFTYSLRPKLADLEAFPPVQLAYFDVLQKEYVILETEPLPIDISAAEQLQGAEIAMSSRPAADGSGIEVSEEGIFANVTDLNMLRDERVYPDRWFMGLGGMAGLFLLIVAGKQQVDRRASDAGLSRRRKAIRRVRQRLGEVQHNQTPIGPQVDRLSTALVGLVADVCGIEEQGMTSLDAVERLQGLQVPAPLIDRFQSLLDECDAIRYGSGSGKLAGLVDSATSIVDELTTTLRKTKHLP